VRVEEGEVAKKKTRKKAAKKKGKKPESAILDLKLLFRDLSAAQRELNQVQRRLQKLRPPFCLRARVVKHK
jgi:hypothetical protein